MFLLFNELRFGVIYLAGNNHSQNRWIHHLERVFTSLTSAHDLQGMQVEPLYDSEAQSPMLVARRMNLGNMGRVAVARLLLPPDPDGLDAEALKAFADAVTEVSATDTGDRIIHAEDWGFSDDEGCCYDMAEPAPPTSAEPVEPMESAKNPSWFSRSILHLNNTLSGFITRESAAHIAPSERDALTEQEDREVCDIETARAQALEELKRAVLTFVLTHHQDPTHIIQEFIQGKYVIGKDNLSPLVVNGDMQLVLPGYDEAQVKMPALCRAIYILFLRHRHDGIVLKNFDVYRKELEEIYALVMPGRDEQNAAVTLDNLCNPLSNTLSEYISKIKKCFRAVLGDEQLLARYIIAGNRGEPYRIDLPDDMVVLPNALTNQKTHTS